MPGHKYQRPKDKVIKVFQGKELEIVLQSALQSIFSSDGVHVTPAKTRRVLDSLPHSVLGGNVVVIIEQFPLDSMTAHGKFKDLIYARIGKTGNQYAKKDTKPRNPRTPAQEAQRAKMAPAQAAWHSLSPAQKAVWEKKAKGLPKNGSNLFISNYLLTH